MHVFIQDTNGVTSTQAEMWRVWQSSPINFYAVLKNAGANNIDYQFQESSDGTTWSSITGANGTLTTSAGSQLASFKISSSLATVRLVASSTTTSTLDFAVTRYATRADGGALPLVSM